MLPPLGIAQNEATSAPRLPEHLHRTSGGCWGHTKFQWQELKSYFCYSWSAIMAHIVWFLSNTPHLLHVTHAPNSGGPGAQEKLVTSSCFQSVFGWAAWSHTLCVQGTCHQTSTCPTSASAQHRSLWVMSEHPIKTDWGGQALHLWQNACAASDTRENAISTTVDLKISIHFAYHCIIYLVL